MSSTTAIAVETGHRIGTTGGKFLATDVSFGHTEEWRSMVKSLPVRDRFHAAPQDQLKRRSVRITPALSIDDPRAIIGFNAARVL
jgi:hypothetical protein